MHLDQILRTRRAMKAIDVLGDEEQIATGLTDTFFESNKRRVRGVGTRAQGLFEARQIPPPRADWILAEVLKGAELGHVAFPDGGRIRSTERRNTAGETDARTRDHQDAATRVGAEQIGCAFDGVHREIVAREQSARLWAEPLWPWCPERHRWNSCRKSQSSTA